MSSTGVVEHLDKAPERWAFLLRSEDGTAANVELRGRVHGTLADGHQVEVVESRTIAADDVIVARRLRNVTLASTVTARQAGRATKLVAFLVPQSIWTPVGGMGAALFGYFAAGTTRDDGTGAQSPSPTPTPEPAIPPGGHGFPIVVVVLVAAVLLTVATVLVIRRRDAPGGGAPPPARAAPRSSGGAARFALVVVAGVLVGVVLNVVIT